jgi:hypothetical protein
MKRLVPLVFVAAVLLYLPALRYGFVQDDRAIIVSNPAAHSVTRALAAFDAPYWPVESGAGLYRPLTTLSYAVDWTVSGGHPAWMHFVNALLHAVAVLLFALVMARWLPAAGAAGAALLFAWHPVHVEAVANLVGRAELLAAVGILGAVLAARRGRFALAVLCAAFAMLSKEHGVIVGVVILLDRWLEPEAGRRTPPGFWIALAAVTAAFVGAWLVIGRSGAGDAAAVFYGRGMFGRLAVALPAVLRAAWLLVWPVSLSSDYGPQVIPSYDGLSFAAMLGALIVAGVVALVWWCRRRAPAISFAAGLAALSYLPTSNLLFASGVVLAERNLYLAVALPAALVGTGFAWLELRRGIRPAIAAAGLAAMACGVLSLMRLPAWRDNRAQLLTLLVEHPESYRGHASAAAVLAGSGDTAGARKQYRIADSLFAGDPYLDAAHAIFLLGVGDTAAAVPLVARVSARPGSSADRIGLRARFLLEWRRGDRTGAQSVADSARSRFPSDSAWYRQYLQ